MTDMKTNTSAQNESVKRIEPAPAAANAGGPELTVPYILTQMAAIQNDTAYIHKALDSLIQVLSGNETSQTGPTGWGYGGREINLGPGAVMPDDPRETAADAVKHVVMSRETTNQQLLRTYEAMLQYLLSGMEPNIRA